MKIENEWLENEMIQIVTETKNKKKRKFSDSIILVKFGLILGIVFFCATSLEARPTKNSNVCKFAVVDGGHRQFTCWKCDTVQWQDKCNADWAGNFHCRRCGNNLGR